MWIFEQAFMDKDGALVVGFDEDSAEADDVLKYMNKMASSDLLLKDFR